MLVKWTTGANFSHMFMSSFYAQSAKYTDDLTVFLLFWDLRKQNLLVKCVKLTTGGYTRVSKYMEWLIEKMSASKRSVGICSGTFGKWSQSNKS